MWNIFFFNYWKSSSIFFKKEALRLSMNFVWTLLIFISWNVLYMSWSFTLNVSSKKWANWRISQLPLLMLPLAIKAENHGWKKMPVQNYWHWHLLRKKVRLFALQRKLHRCRLNSNDSIDKTPDGYWKTMLFVLGNSHNNSITHHNYQWVCWSKFEKPFYCIEIHS